MSSDEEYLRQYDKLATEIINDENITGPGGYNHPQMVKMICQMLDWEDFDLVHDNYDFEEAYKNGNSDETAAYTFLAYLRNNLFTAANQRNIGPEKVRIYGSVLHEYWFKKLIDKVVALQNNKEIRHDWIH